MRRTIHIACGGTGGHIFPGLEAARELKRRGHDVTLWLTGRERRYADLESWDGPVVWVGAAGFSRNPSWRWPLSAALLGVGTVRAVARMKKEKPDALLAMGSYASVPAALAASLAGVPVILHEANAVPGRAVSFLSRFASVVAVTFEQSCSAFRHAHTVVTGFPVRADILCARRQDAAPDGRLRLLIMGGSQGAHVLNERVSEAICSVWRQGRRLRVIHLSGEKDREDVETRYAQSGVDASVFAFLSDMSSAYANTDFVIARAGAATCSELCAVRLPALLIPLPFARRDHQAANARALAATGAVDVMGQKDVSISRLSEYIVGILDNAEGLDAKREAFKNIQVADGAARLADLVEEYSRGES